jgi:hypothetical protein
MTTREQIIQLREENPRITAITMATMIGVSKSRVRAILLEENLPTKILKLPVFCKQCNLEEQQDESNFCSPECRENYYYIQLICLECEGVKRVSKALYYRNIKNGQRQFCCHRCRHLWYWAFKKSGGILLL